LRRFVKERRGAATGRRALGRVKQAALQRRRPPWSGRGMARKVLSPLLSPLGSAFFTAATLSATCALPCHRVLSSHPLLSSPSAPACSMLYLIWQSRSFFIHHNITALRRLRINAACACCTGRNALARLLCSYFVLLAAKVCRLRPFLTARLARQLCLAAALTSFTVSETQRATAMLCRRRRAVVANAWRQDGVYAERHELTRWRRLQRRGTGGRANVWLAMDGEDSPFGVGSGASGYGVTAGWRI